MEAIVVISHRPTHRMASRVVTGQRTLHLMELMEARVVNGRRRTHLIEAKVVTGQWPQANSPSQEWWLATGQLNYRASVVTGRRPTHLLKARTDGFWVGDIAHHREVAVLQNHVSHDYNWDTDERTGTGTILYRYTRTKTKYHMWCHKIAFPELDALKI